MHFQSASSPSDRPAPYPAERFNPAASGRALHILIVDDHALVADSLEAYMMARGEPVRVSKAATVPQALAIADASSTLDLVLLDLHLPEMDGLTGLRLLRARRPGLPIAILSGDVSPRAPRIALDAGANGFIPKTLGGPAVLAAMRVVLAGGRYVPAEFERKAAGPLAPGGLTAREQEVLRALIQGRSNKEIARALGISAATVALHLTNIYRKLGTTTRTQAVRRAFEFGLRTDHRRR